MINLDVEGYCQQCLDFAPEVITAKRVMNEDGNIFWSDTIIRCEYHKRCAGIKRYLEQQMRGGRTDERQP